MISPLCYTPHNKDGSLSLRIFSALEQIRTQNILSSLKSLEEEARILIGEQTLPPVKRTQRRGSR